MSSIIKVDTIQNQSGANIISESSNTITVGASGDTITVPSGATLGGAGTVDLSSATVTLNDTMKMAPSFFVHRNGTSQTITDSTMTKVQFTTEAWDTNNAFDNSTNYTFTVPSGHAGKYFLGMSERYSSSAVWSGHMYMYKNGSTIVSATSYTNGYYTQSGNTVILDLSVGDTLSCSVWQNSGSNRSLDGAIHYTYFYGYKMIGI